MFARRLPEGPSVIHIPGQEKLNLRSQVVILIFAVAVSVSQLGCYTMHNSRGWGQDATLVPNKQRVRRAAQREEGSLVRVYQPNRRG